MILISCAVRDAKVGAFSPPMFFRSKGEAIRSFLDATADTNTSLSKHPSDYQMFALALFDDQTGIFELMNPVELLVSGEERK